MIFLPLLVLGGVLSFILAYYYGGYGSYGAYLGRFESFWNDWFGFNNGHRGFDYAWPILLWFVPYLSVMLVRSVWWSIKVLNLSKRARYGIAVSIAAIVAAVGGAIGIKNAVDHRQDVAKSKGAPELPPRVSGADFRKIILFDVTYANRVDGLLGFVGGVEGRLRNELPRKIGRLELTLSFFNSTGELIETQPVTIDEVFIRADPRVFMPITYGP